MLALDAPNRTRESDPNRTSETDSYERTNERTDGEANSGRSTPRLSQRARAYGVMAAAGPGESPADAATELGRFAGTVEAVLPLLEDIVAECLPDVEVR